MNDVTTTATGLGATVEILIMLAGAVVLGYLLRATLQTMPDSERPAVRPAQRKPEAKKYLDIDDEHDVILVPKKSVKKLTIQEDPEEAEYFERPIPRPESQHKPRQHENSNNQNNGQREHKKDQHKQQQRHNDQPKAEQDRPQHNRGDHNGNGNGGNQHKKDHHGQQNNQGKKDHNNNGRNQRQNDNQNDHPREQRTDNQAAKPATAPAPAAVTQTQPAIPHGITKDDLKVVDGVGPKIEQILNEAGIKTWQDLAKTPAQDLKDLLVSKGERYRIHDPRTWPEQAKLMVDGKWTELTEYQAFLSGGKVLGS